jgi:hypothetical protein
MSPSTPPFLAIGLYARLLPAFAPAAAPATGSGPDFPYYPFIDPIHIHGTWWIFLLPMALGIAIVYKAVRLPTLDRYLWHVAVMTAQIVLGMLLLAAASYLLVIVFAAFIARQAGG